EGGEVVVGGVAISLEDLGGLLGSEAQANPDRLVLVQADEKAVHARVVAVMEVARGAGLTNLAIATRGVEPEE
ncbi:MAG: biopolymer transporter ExbD, partial [Myxococcota bacterium]